MAKKKSIFELTGQGAINKSSSDDGRQRLDTKAGIRKKK